MRQFFHSCFAISILALTATAAAQNPQETEQSTPIIVNGEREIEERIAKFVDAAVAAPEGGRFVGQFARLSAKICPGVYGFSKNTGSVIADRIRAVAKAADIRTGETDCAPNVFVVVVGKGSDAVNFLRKNHRGIFGKLPIYSRDKIERSQGPVYGWRNRYTVSAETGHIIDGSFEVGQPPANQIRTSSLIKLPVEKQLTTSFLLIEEEALIGLTTTQIADFATLRLLLESDDDATSNSVNDSILTLFADRTAGREPAASITEWDIMLLHAWYAMPADLPAAQQRAAILRIIKNEIANGPKAN